MAAEWERWLPDGVEVNSRHPDGFTLAVPMPAEDGLWLCVCPQDADHRFKIKVTSGADDSADDDTSDIHCPYCGHRAPLWDFAPDQMQRMMTAATAAAEQMLQHDLSKMLGEAFGATRHRDSGISVTYEPGRPPPRRALPAVTSEPTRRTLTCQRCKETVAVYGLAVYRPACGRMAPAQQFAELIRGHRERLAALDALDALDPAGRRALDEAGVSALTHESTVKDAFGALETYLKDRFTEAAPDVAIPRARGNVFQRLDDANALYVEHLGLDLRALAGPATWDQLTLAAALRHVLTHNAGIVDAKFLARQPRWPQAEGQRLNVTRRQVDTLLDALESFASSALNPSDASTAQGQGRG